MYCPYAGWYWGQQWLRRPIPALMGFIAQWDKQTHHQAVTAQSGQAWDGEAQRTGRAQRGCLNQLRIRESFPEEVVHELTEMSKMKRRERCALGRRRRYGRADDESVVLVQGTERY